MTLNSFLYRCSSCMRWFWLVLLLNTGLLTFGQLGGSYTYQYLQLPVSARMAALGGAQVAAITSDLSSAWLNPATANASMHHKLSVNHAVKPGNINHGWVAYARQADQNPLTFFTGLMYNAYGTMPLYDASGIQSGSFTASEYALGAGVAYHAARLTYGANLKLLYGQLETYQSVGAAVDIGASYADTIKQFYAGMVLRHIGTQFTAYSPGTREELPFEWQLGVSKRLAYLPLLISVTGHNLQQFDIRYDNPLVSDNSNIFNIDTNQTEPSYLGDKILRHIILAGEFYFGDHFQARLGYDFMQQKEMLLTTYRGLSGFSVGFGLNYRRLTFDYGYEVASVAGGNHYVSVSTRIDQFLDR